MEKKILFPALSAAALSLCACGGSGGSGSNVPNNATQSQILLNQAVRELNAAIANPRQVDYTLLTESANDFLSSYQLSPSPQAAVGYAVAEPPSLSQNISGTYGQGDVGAPMVVRLINSLPVWQQPSKTLTVVPAINSISDVMPTSIFGVVNPAASAASVGRGGGGGGDITQILNDVAALNNLLTQVITKGLTTSNITQLEQKPLVITAPVPFHGGFKLEQVKIGAAEGYTARATLEELKGATDLILAYNLNYGSYDFSQNFVTRFKTEVQNGAYIPAATYLPTNFLKLQSAATMRDTGVQWLAGGNDATSALNQITQRIQTNSVGWIADVYGSAAGIYSLSSVSTAQSAVDHFKSDLTQPLFIGRQKNYVGFVSPPVTLHLSAWIGPSANPPKNLVAFFPCVTTVASVAGKHYQYGHGEMPIVAVPGTIADPGYGGLVSGLSNHDPYAALYLYNLRARFEDVPTAPVPIYQVALVAAAP